MGDAIGKGLKVIAQLIQFIPGGFNYKVIDKEKAQKGMERAQRDKERALEQSAQAEERAGIRKQTDAMDSVLNIMTENAKKAESEAAAAKSRAKLLSKTSVEDNSLVAAAIAKAEGKSTEKKSVADRLADL